VSGSGISWGICKSAPHPRQVIKYDWDIVPILILTKSWIFVNAAYHRCPQYIQSGSTGNVILSKKTKLKYWLSLHLIHPAHIPPTPSFHGHFPREPRWAYSVTFPHICSKTWSMRLGGLGFLWSRCPSCHPMNSVKKQWPQPVVRHQPFFFYHQIPRGRGIATSMLDL